MKPLYAAVMAILLFFCCVAPASSADAFEKTDILVSLDFTEALVKVLTADTACTVTRAVPAKYSSAVHEHYLKKHPAEFQAKAARAAGVVAVSGAWPSDPLYPWARRANIRIVNIDAVHPLDRSRAGLPLLNSAAPQYDTPPAVWNSPGNAARMADIVAADLGRLAPAENEQIRTNLDAFKRDLFTLRSRYESAFSRLDAFEVAALTEQYIYLTDEFGISVVQTFLKPEIRRQTTDLESFSEALRAYDVKGVVCSWEPDAAIARRIREHGAKSIILQPFTLQSDAPADAQLLRFYEQNLDALLKGLSG